MATSVVGEIVTWNNTDATEVTSATGTGMAYITAGVLAARAPSAMPLFSSYYYDSMAHIAGAGWSGSALTAGRLYATPFYVPHAITVDRLGVNVTTGVASALGKAGIYTMGSNGRPGTLVIQGSSNLDCATSATAPEHTISQALDGGKWYWAAFVSDSAISIHSAAPTTCPVGYGTAASGVTKTGSYFLTLGSLTLPDPFGVPTNTTANLYRIFYRTA
jgi:hypothetical protein